jgi:hypothetical protein
MHEPVPSTPEGSHIYIQVSHPTYDPRGVGRDHGLHINEFIKYISYIGKF